MNNLNVGGLYSILLCVKIDRDKNSRNLCNNCYSHFFLYFCYLKRIFDVNGIIMYDNLRFGAHLNMSGFFKDVELSDEFHIKAATVIAYGRLELAKLYIRLELDDLGDTNIPEIPEVSSLLKSGINPFDVKTLLRRVQDNQYEYGVNTEMLYKLVGEECTSVILNTISGYFNKLEDNPSEARFHRDEPAPSSPSQACPPSPSQHGAVSQK